MTPYDILEAIGEVDENAVAQADRRRTNRKKVFAAVGSALAACRVLCVFIPIAAMIFRSYGSGDKAGSESAPEVVVYFVGEDGIESVVITRDVRDEQVLFALWKERNGVGEDLLLLNVERKADSSAGVKVVFTFEGNLENYGGNGTLLSETLRLTLSQGQEGAEIEFEFSPSGGSGADGRCEVTE